MLVLEQDDTLLDFDRRTLYGAVRRARYPDLRYEQQRAAAEPLLALPDAVAWCRARGGEWRRRVEPVITGVRTV